MGSLRCAWLCMDWLVVAVIAGAGTTERDGTGKEVGRETYDGTPDRPRPGAFLGMPAILREVFPVRSHLRGGWMGGGTVVSKCLCLRSASFEVLEKY